MFDHISKHQEKIWKYNVHAAHNSIYTNYDRISKQCDSLDFPCLNAVKYIHVLFIKWVWEIKIKIKLNIIF